MNEIICPHCKKAKEYFLSYHDNLALREINRLVLSNASQTVKEQARTIKDFVPEPDFTTIRDSFTFEEVAADPPLYEGCFVVWRGRISNLDVNEERVQFDLLVGYDTSEVLEGVVEVVLNFGVVLTQGRVVEILGAVRLEDGETLSLRGISVHKLSTEQE